MRDARRTYAYAAAPRERANAADGPFSAACYVRRRGSMASRTASPNRFNPRTETAMAQPGKMEIHGAFRMYFWESWRMFPTSAWAGLAQTEERQRRLGEQDLGKIETELDHDHRQAIWHDGAENQPPAGAPQRLGCDDVLLRDHREGHPTRHPHDPREIDHAQRHDDALGARPKRRRHRHGQEERREGHHEIHAPHDQGADPARADPGQDASRTRAAPHRAWSRARPSS